MQGAPWPVEATTRSSLESYLRWLDGQAGVTGTYEYVTEPSGDEQPVLSIRYMDCPQPGTLLGFTFGISTVANPLWGGLRPELAICVDSTDARWAWALADIGDRVRTTSVFLPGDTIEVGESISPESPMESFVLWHQLITDDDEAIFRMGDHEVVLVQAIPLHQVELEHLRRQTDRAVGVKTLLHQLSEQGLELTDVHRDPLAVTAGTARGPAEPVRVLSHLGGASGMGLPDDLVERVVVTAVAMHGAPEAGLSGEILVTIPAWAENTDELLACGVRWMHYISTGVDGVDLGALPPDLLVTNSRGASAVPISEWVLAVMLAFEKHLPQIWLDEPPADWRADPRLGTLHGRRVAIVGFGSIGEAVAERVLPFGTEVRALRRTRRPSPMAGVEMVGSLAEVLDGADHVVIAAPLTPATHHLIGAEAFALMKPGVHLVNIARGGLVDQDALRAALDDGTVALASLDAVDPEPLPAGHWMFSHPQVRVSAHDSWSWPGSGRTIFDRFAVNLRAYLAGEPLPDLVDPSLGY